MITRSNGLEPDTFQVTFLLPAHAHDEQPMSVVGDFNGWCPAALPMARSGGTLTATVTLPAGGRYRFRYLTETGWFNDAHADAFETDAHGIQDGVLVLVALAAAG